MGWISVEDEQPREGQRAVFYSVPTTVVGYWHHSMGNPWVMSNGQRYVPTHWMPLPDPPEAQLPFRVADGAGRFSAHTVYDKEYGFVYTFPDKMTAVMVCSNLNRIWELDKGSIEDTQCHCNSES